MSQQLSPQTHKDESESDQLALSTTTFHILNATHNIINKLPIHHLLALDEFDAAEQILRYCPRLSSLVSTSLPEDKIPNHYGRGRTIDLLATDSNGNSALHVAVLAARGVPLDYLSAGVNAQRSTKNKQPSLRTPSTKPPRRLLSPAVAASALLVVDVLLEKGGGDLLLIRNKDGYWAGQLCCPGTALDRLLTTLHKSFIHAVSECKNDMLEQLR